MPSPDQFDTIIEAVNGGYGREATRLLKPVPARARPRVRQPHRALWFAATTAVWLSVAIELRLLQLLWHVHG
jgi:hypothetical protein